MKPLHYVAAQIVSWGVVLAGGVVGAVAGERHVPGGDMFARQVMFELTFANRDLIWVGDPGSPTALVYVKPGARPMATDMHVSTVVESNQSPGRSYLHEARIAADDRACIVYAFTRYREKAIGVIDRQGHFLPNEFYRSNRELLPTWPSDASVLAYDAKENALFYEVDVPGPRVTESLDFLPLELSDAEGNAVTGRFSIRSARADTNGTANARSVSLTLQHGENSVTLAKANMPRVFRRADVQLGSFDNKTGAYVPELAYRADASCHPAMEPSVTIPIAGEFSTAVQSDRKSLIVVDAPQSSERSKIAPTQIVIDGNFDDWRNITGVDDRRGDLVPYLDYNPDVDLLEFKVAHDDQHIYLYARVAGQVGRSQSAGGRSYFYAYMDVDRDAGTGFLPSREDDCYFGVDIGDDCEVQFEFVNGTLRKTFYGFCGLGGNDNVLNRTVTLGKSQYHRFDEEGVERANYKSEYIYRNGITEITEDLKFGTSDTIRLAVSPDGSEVEISSSFTGFLNDPQGRPTVGIGQTIDLAAGMECGSKANRGKSRWGADSTIAIRGYALRPADPRQDGN